MLLERCVGKPGAGFSGEESEYPVTTMHAAVCPAGHEGARPVVVVDLSRSGHRGGELPLVPEGCCPACPGERLMPSGRLPVTAGGPGDWCRCCLAMWRPGTDWWGCADTGRLISVAGPVSPYTRIQAGPDAARIKARALAGFLLSAGRPVAQTLAAGPLHVTVYKHAGRRYAVVTSESAQIKAVFKATTAAGELRLRRLDWLRASAGPAVLALLARPAHRR